MTTLAIVTGPARRVIFLCVAATVTALLPISLTLAAGDPVQGKALYQSNCASCHGPNAAGGIKIGSATSPSLQWTTLGPTYNQDTAAVLHSIQAGVDEAGKPLDPAMPHFQTTLSVDQINNIIAFLQTLTAPAAAPALPKTGGPLGSSELPWLAAGAACVALAGVGLRRLYRTRRA